MNKPSNLLFFLSDNHNSDFLGCYGHPVVRTPYLDKLASSGTRFENAYCASPLCCPARAALATGRFPHQTGYWDNALAYDGRVASWMHRLRDAGYTVVSIGKLHFKSPDNDNGFSEEIIPMHILNGHGAVKNLLRSYDQGEPDSPGDERWKLYFPKSAAGDTDYQQYDRAITRHATTWLKNRASTLKQPWALFVSYPSPHPPLIAPQRLLDLYPLDSIPLPPRFSPGERSTHPAAEYQRRKFGTWDIVDETSLRKAIAAYCSLITHVDEQVGEVMAALRSMPALNPRFVYTSDHGEMLGAHGILGKGVLYEKAVRVPLIMAGEGIPEGRTVTETVSHVDLFPTLLESCGVGLHNEDNDLPGASLWPAMTGSDRKRTAFAEYHANFSKSGSFMLRDGAMKLIYHVGMPAQLFDLENDRQETTDLMIENPGAHRTTAAALEGQLRRICNPEEINQRAKADQRRLAEHYGGPGKIFDFGSITFTPSPQHR